MQSEAASGAFCHRLLSRSEYNTVPQSNDDVPL
jgi:hypothetical protein